MSEGNLRRGENSWPLAREAFALVEARAREILRERGYSQEQIENELNRPRRAEFDG